MPSVKVAVPGPVPPAARWGAALNEPREHGIDGRSGGAPHRGPAGACVPGAPAACGVTLTHPYDSRPRPGTSAGARTAVRRFVVVCVEVLNGYRPPAHLRGLARPAEAAGIVAQMFAGTHRVAELRRLRGRASRAADRHGRGAAPVAVLRMRLCEPRPGAVEAAVLLVTGERTWALALRLEEHDEQWAATALRLV